MPRYIGLLTVASALTFPILDTCKLRILFLHNLFVYFDTQNCLLFAILASWPFSFIMHNHAFVLWLLTYLFKCVVTFKVDHQLMILPISLEFQFFLGFFLHIVCILVQDFWKFLWQVV